MSELPVNSKSYQIPLADLAQEAIVQRLAGQSPWFHHCG